MQRTIQAINNSVDLAELLNTHAPLTEADAAETPVDWPGVALLGADGIVTYEVDQDASTATRCVLAGGIAAVDYKTEWHAGCPLFNTMPDIAKPHWCPAVHDATTWDDCEATVTLDWRSVYVGQGSFAATTVHDTLEAAQQAYEQEVKWMQEAIDSADDDSDDN